ncbi:hypothetical protein P167DRAFT_367757 [Morchella conica CCBAS932]|uniref:Uncharacterized protein n=1 Tax=Morchella conica CCBAS932 TaxID=1392247 RepID=A0A3N4KFF0_9PEZI|nr:hypothetical protein P167DRAFT_367757 [Morchella conica CCBAS932]
MLFQVYVRMCVFYVWLEGMRSGDVGIMKGRRRESTYVCYTGGYGLLHAIFFFVGLRARWELYLDTRRTVELSRIRGTRRRVPSLMIISRCNCLMFINYKPP